MEEYKFYITAEQITGKEGVLFPVTPQSFKMKVPGKNKTLTLTNGQEVNLIRPAGLVSVDCEMLLPSHAQPFARYPDGFKRPKYYIDILEKLKTGHAAFTFTVLRTMRFTPEMILAASAKTGKAIDGMDVDRDGRITARDAIALDKKIDGSAIALDPTELTMTLEEYTLTEDASRYGTDMLVSLKMKQYRKYEAIRLKLS